MRAPALPDSALAIMRAMPGVLVMKWKWSHTTVAEQLNKGELPPGWQQVAAQWRQAHPA